MTYPYTRPRADWQQVWKPFTVAVVVPNHETATGERYVRTDLVRSVGMVRAISQLSANRFRTVAVSSERSGVFAVYPYDRNGLEGDA